MSKICKLYWEFICYRNRWIFQALVQKLRYFGIVNTISFIQKKICNTLREMNYSILGLFKEKCYTPIGSIMPLQLCTYKDNMELNKQIISGSKLRGNE